MRAPSDELRGGRARRWNAEGFIFFQMVILQCTHYMSGDQEIRWRIGKRLYTWDAGQNQMLVEDMACMCNQ